MSPARGVKVSWERVCYPKSEGDLGIKDLLIRNKACILRNLWSIWMKAGSLWVASIDLYRLRSCCVLEVQSCSWHCWARKKLLRLRSLLPSLGGLQEDFKSCKAWEKLREKIEKVMVNYIGSAFSEV